MKRLKFSNQEKLEVIAKTYLLSKDLGILHDCSQSTASTIYMSAFKNYCNENQVSLKNDKIPTDLYLKSCDYPVERIIKFAKLGL